MIFEDTFFGRENTVKTYTSLFRKHIKPVVDINMCKSWTDNNTLNTIKQWKTLQLSTSTQSTLLRLLNKYIIFNGGSAIEINHYMKLLSRSAQQREVQVLSRKESERLLSICKIQNPEFYPVILFALHAGLRRGEVYGLRFGDIEFLKNRIKVSRSYDGPTKNGKTRYVPMSTHLSDVVSQWFFKLRLDDKLFKIENPNPKLRKLCRASNIPLINFHGLRHSYATMALESKISPRKVQAWLGHASLTTTLNIYWGLDNTKESLEFLPQS